MVTGGWYWFDKEGGQALPRKGWSQDEQEAVTPSVGFPGWNLYPLALLHKNDSENRPSKRVTVVWGIIYKVLQLVGGVG